MNEFTTRQLIEDLMLVVDSSLPRCNQDSEEYKLFLSLKNELIPLRTRCIRATSDYKVAIVGLGNVGKSTLINAVLGLKVAPTCNAACTANIVEFCYGEEFKIVASQKDRILPEEFFLSSEKELYQKLTEMVAHDNLSEDCWDHISVYVPATVLSNGLILVDTPGFGAAGDEGDKDNGTIKNFLEKDVAQIFWTVMADQGIGSKEFSFYKEYLFSRCDDLIVTNGEDWDETDRKRWCRRFSPKLRQSLRIHFVKGKQATNARQENNLLAWEDSGVATVCDRIQNLKNRDGRLDEVCRSVGLLGEVVSKKIKNFPEGKLNFCPIALSNFKKKHYGNNEISSWLKI